MRGASLGMESSPKLEEMVAPELSGVSGLVPENADGFEVRLSNIFKNVKGFCC